MYQAFQTTGLLLDSVQNLKDILVYGTQRPKKSMAEEAGHGGRVKSSKSIAMVLGYGRRPCHFKMTNTLDKDPYEWCLRQSKRLKAIDPQMNIQMRNHRPLTQMPGELYHAVKCRCNHNCTLDEIANTLKDVRKRASIGKYTPYKSISLREKQPFRVEFKEKPGERVAEVAKKKNSCHNCGSTDHYANNCPKKKKTSMPLRKSQRKNPQQRTLTQTLWLIPSEKNMMMTKTQEKNS
ncbi:hypothetical protein O181_129948 [Austropuccinia psidii MF-1]|uniref:CCHC-type domain-containing protein n=1 Tax=Austropuccinia psidii MF-1 TaxID=1389203 RepID=A0A9Q3KXP8_9BASI|nr:hypothetical protein [Austropuccinia psidii MF-1]